MKHIGDNLISICSHLHEATFELTPRWKKSIGLVTEVLFRAGLACQVRLGEYLGDLRADRRMVSKS